jgi:hypothetical protein
MIMASRTLPSVVAFTYLLIACFAVWPLINGDIEKYGEVISSMSSDVAKQVSGYPVISAGDAAAAGKVVKLKYLALLGVGFFLSITAIYDKKRRFLWLLLATLPFLGHWFSQVGTHIMLFIYTLPLIARTTNYAVIFFRDIAPISIFVLTFAISVYQIFAKTLSKRISD